MSMSQFGAEQWATAVAGASRSPKQMVQTAVLQSIAEVVSNACSSVTHSSDAAATGSDDAAAGSWDAPVASCEGPTAPGMPSDKVGRL